MAASSASSVASACSSTDAKIEPGSKQSEAVFKDGLLVQENTNKRKVRAEVLREEAMWKVKYEEVQAKTVEAQAQLKRLKMQLALVKKETEAIRLDRSMSGAVGRLSARAQELTLQ